MLFLECGLMFQPKWKRKKPYELLKTHTMSSNSHKPKIYWTNYLIIHLVEMFRYRASIFVFLGFFWRFFLVVFCWRIESQSIFLMVKNFKFAFITLSHFHLWIVFFFHGAREMTQGIREFKCWVIQSSLHFCCIWNGNPQNCMIQVFSLLLSYYDLALVACMRHNATGRIRVRRKLNQFFYFINCDISLEHESMQKAKTKIPWKTFYINEKSRIVCSFFIFLSTSFFFAKQFKQKEAENSEKWEITFVDATHSVQCNHFS